MPAAESAFIDLGTILDAVADAVLIVDARDAERAVVRTNDAFSRLTGYDSAAVRGRSAMLLAGPESDASVQQQLREAIGAGSDFSAEWIIHRKDGSPVWTRVTSKPARDASGALACIVVTLQEISEHKRARESLRISEARLAVAMDASGLSMWDWNVVRDEVSYNERWRESLGLEASALLARRSLSDRLMLPADEPDVLERFQRHFDGYSACFESEYRLDGADARPKWFLAHAKVVRRGENGKPQRVIGVLRDISERKQELQDALEAQRRWERAAHGTSDGLYDWNLISGHVWYAARFREIVGYGERDFPDTFVAFQSVLHPDDRSLVLGKIRTHLENRARLDIRCRVKTRGGEILWCRLRGEAERDAAGRPLRLAGSLSDISAQIEAEEALTRSQDFYGTILESLPLFIAYVDREQRVVYANRMFQDFFDVPLASLRGRILREVIGEARYAMIGSHLGGALDGMAVEGQGRFQDAAGRLFDLDAAFIPHRDEAGAIQGCFLAARDVTEKRQLEAGLRQSQKMEAVGRLTGGVAHDFNNLLSVIVGNLQLLGRSLRESPRLLRQTETALNAALRGADLTRRLLAFARQQVLEPKIVDLNALIAGMYELLRRTLTGEVEIRRELEGEPWLTKADPGQLENAVLNLVINARDAMPTGGTITIATRNAAIGPQEHRPEEALPPGEYVVLEVRDTGVGMSAETLKRALEPFFTTKDVTKGSGLGLSIVYGFVRQSGGHVHIESTPGLGTSVYLYFPRSHASPERASLAAGSPEDLPRGHETILVVEDNAEVRATVLDILGSLGYRLLEAANGQQALEQFTRNPDIALVFSDIMLPGGLLGTQLIQKLTERNPQLKVLMTSGFNESGIMQRGLVDGSIELLPKPYNVEDLARRVREKLDGTEEQTRVPA